MVHERRLTLAVVLKSNENRINFNELRCSYRRHEDQKEEETLEEKASRGLNLTSCFVGYSAEETLGGDDQWYCSVCKEHRDITKKLEIYTVPRIFII